MNCSWGQAPKPPGLASLEDGCETYFREMGWPLGFCEAELRFLLLFLEKEEYNSKNSQNSSYITFQARHWTDRFELLKTQRILPLLIL
jgi:hypothetical protein